jgi:hypothetical protein
MTDLEDALRLARNPTDSNGHTSTDAERAIALALIELVNTNKSQLAYLQQIDRRLEKPPRKFFFLRRKEK